MKSTSRTGPAVPMTGTASAAASAPVPVPPAGPENVPPIEPRGAVPVPRPGAIVVVERGEGRLLPRDVPPVHSAPPRTALNVPVADPVSRERVAGLGVASVHSPAPGLDLGAPLTAPGAGPQELPGATPPRLTLLPPAPQAEPRAGTRLF